jgi:hypothetical protein
MKKRRPAASTLVLDEPSRTGHHCPKTGWWSALGDSAEARFIIRGEVMPALNGTPASWAFSGAVGATRSPGLESALHLSS